MEYFRNLRVFMLCERRFQKYHRQIIVLIIIYMVYLLSSFYSMLKESNSNKNAQNIEIKEDQAEFLQLNFSKMKWIVVTSVGQPTKQIKKLANIKDFQLLVVGDKKTDQNWYHNNTIYLNIKMQEFLNYKTFKTTPFNSYTRKNIGYLFAIKHGAKYIYDTDDDNEPLVNLTEYFHLNKYGYGMIIDCKSPKVVNPYAHFGQPLIWPRGYPLSEIQKNHYNNYICGKRKTSVVQQGVVNGDPDVDAIFRLTKTMNYKRINITFDGTSPSIQYPVYKLAPYNSQNTFFHYEAFWSLYLPYTVTFRLTDIWRSYWAQRLMWLLNDTITFNGPNAFQFRNSHSYLKDFNSEKSMYTQTEKLIEFLFKWKCPKKKFYECVIDLSHEMAIQKFWKMNEVYSIKNWLQDLTMIGYQEPKILNFENSNNICSEYETSSDPNNHFQVRYTPKFQKSIDFDSYCCEGKIQMIYDNYESINFLEDFCSKSNASINFKINHIGRESNYSKITLLITFNSDPYAKNIEVIHHVYRYYFKNIIFCGSKIHNILNETKNSFKKFDSYTFIDVDVGWAGVSHYFCMTRAIEMDFSTEGILLMSDDVLLKYWKLDKYDLKKIWYPFKLECKQEFVLESVIKGWGHWSQLSLNQVIGIWNRLEMIVNGSEKVDKKNLEIVKNYIETIKFNSITSNDTSNYTSMNKTKICSCFGSDIFYLPKNYFEKFHFISSIFRPFNLFLEIALPTILAGIEKNTLIDILDGDFMWRTLHFDFEFHNYENVSVFVHPSKISKYNSSNNGRLFCQKFIQEHINNII